jgi:hypothetical protein
VFYPELQHVIIRVYHIKIIVGNSDLVVARNTDEEEPRGISSVLFLDTPFRVSVRARRLILLEANEKFAEASKNILET